MNERLRKIIKKKKLRIVRLISSLHNYNNLFILIYIYQQHIIFLIVEHRFVLYVYKYTYQEDSEWYGNK